MQSKQHIIRSLILAIFFCHAQVLFSQTAGDSAAEITPNLSLNYMSISSDSVILTADIYVRRETGLFSLENAEIEFGVSNGTENKKIGTVQAGYNGKAILKIAANAGLLRDKDGKTTFSVTFQGKGAYQPVSESVTYKTGQILISFSQEDSVRNILVKAFQTEADHEKKPLPSETVNIYVPRMLSDLKIGEVTLDENGEGSFEFPGGVIGDSIGNLTFIGRIEENETFGTIQGQASIDWGIPKHYFLAEKPTRELWTPVAPVWMIVTLIIMLAGVWGHYLYAVIQLILIKRISRRKQEAAEE